MNPDLPKEAREQVGAALVLLKDWKTQDVEFGCREYIEIMSMVGELARRLGVHDEYDRAGTKLPRMRIVPYT